MDLLCVHVCGVGWGGGGGGGGGGGALLFFMIKQKHIRDK
jgi:hypothetical protein